MMARNFVFSTKRLFYLGPIWGHSKRNCCFLSPRVLSTTNSTLSLNSNYNTIILNNSSKTCLMFVREQSSEDDKLPNKLDESKLSSKERIKRAVSAYGSTVIVFHITISLFSLGGCYALVASGFNIDDILHYLNLGSYSSKAATNTGTFVVAYAIHKVFAPVRIGITLTATPFIVKHLRRIGVLKDPTKK